MKPLLRLFLLVVSVSFGLIVGVAVGMGVAVGLSDEGVGWTGVDFENSDRYDLITFGSADDRTTLQSVPVETTTEEIIRGFLTAQSSGNLTPEEFERYVQLSTKSSDRTYSHSKIPTNSYVLGSIAAVLGLMAAWFSGGWLWRFVYAEGD